MLPAGMGLVAVFGELELGAVRSVMAEPDVLSRHAFGSPGTGVGSGVSATSCVGVGLLTGGDVALGVLVGATVGCGVSVAVGVGVLASVESGIPGSGWTLTW